MLIGHARVSKADGSQLLDLQRDALIDAGVAEERIYEDLASGRKDHRPGLDACLKALQLLGPDDEEPAGRHRMNGSILGRGTRSRWCEVDQGAQHE